MLQKSIKISLYTFNRQSDAIAIIVSECQYETYFNALAHLITVHCAALSGPSVEAGDTVSVKVPQKAADVVIVVEQDVQNSEIFKDLILPLVSTLTNELKTKGIT